MVMYHAEVYSNVCLIIVVLVHVLTATMTNSKIPDKMLHDAAFYQVLHCLLKKFNKVIMIMI